MNTTIKLAKTLDQKKLKKKNTTRALLVKYHSLDPKDPFETIIFSPAKICINIHSDAGLFLTLYIFYIRLDN